MENKAIAERIRIAREEQRMTQRYLVEAIGCTLQQVRRQELASDIRFAMWQGFMRNQECYCNPSTNCWPIGLCGVCQESQMHSLPAARAAQKAAHAFT